MIVTATTQTVQWAASPVCSTWFIIQESVVLLPFPCWDYDISISTRLSLSLLLPKMLTLFWRGGSGGGLGLGILSICKICAFTGFKKRQKEINVLIFLTFNIIIIFTSLSFLPGNSLRDVLMNSHFCIVNTAMLLDILYLQSTMATCSLLSLCTIIY